MPTNVFQECFDAHRALISPTQQACCAPLKRLVAIAVTALQSGGKLLFFGNGGSAADAQHLAAELTVRFVRDRCALAAIALGTDPSALTACGNDIGFDRIFARQLEALGRPGDVAIGISTSGNSPNVLSALEWARAHGLSAAAFSGKDGGKLRGIADPLVVVPTLDTARIQEMHILLGHIFCAEIEQQLGLV